MIFSNWFTKKKPTPSVNKRDLVKALKELSANERKDLLSDLIQPAREKKAGEIQHTVVPLSKHTKKRNRSTQIIMTKKLQDVDQAKKYYILAICSPIDGPDSRKATRYIEMQGKDDEDALKQCITLLKGMKATNDPVLHNYAKIILKQVPNFNERGRQWAMAGTKQYLFHVRKGEVTIKSVL